jgi:anionic cell wall polymer biosynthesis LytR-Cps2A-Psr (LCP) family protein
MTRRRKFVLGGFGVLLALLVGLGAWAFVLVSGLDDVPRFDVDMPADGSRPAAAPDPESATILLAGVDNGQRTDLQEMLASGEWTPGAFRSDAIMVLHIPADRRRASLVSIPRDSWVPVEGYGDQKINAAFSYGGPSLLASTVERVIDVRLDHVMVVDWAGFRGITEAVGGVRLGGEELGPEEALRYVRERKSLPNGDFDRVERQQEYLLGVLGSLREQDVWSSPVTLTRTVNSLDDFVAVDSSLTNRGLVDLGWSSRRVTPAELQTLTAPHDGTGTVDGQSIVRLDVERTRDLFDRLVGRR